MSLETEIVEPAVARALPGRSALAASRRLIVAGLVTGVVYSVLTTGSRSGQTSSHSDAQLVQLALSPSPIVYLALAVVYFVAVHRALRAPDEARAVQLFRRATMLVAAIGAVSIVVALLWFFTQPLAGWPSRGEWFAPFPFATQTVSVSPPR